MDKISIRDKSLNLCDKARAIQYTADREKRLLTDAEQSALDSFFREIYELHRNVENAERLEGVAGDLKQTAGPQAAMPPIASHLAGHGASPAGKPKGRILFKNTVTGEPVYGFSGTQPMAAKPLDVPLGEVLAAIMTNDTSRLPPHVQNSLSVGSDTGGGFLAEPSLSQRTVDLARAASVVMKAGATTISIPGSELAIARVDTDATSYWRGETASTLASVPTFGRYVLRPRMLAAIVPISEELLADAPNSSQLIEATLQASLGAELDRVILEGSGASNEPLGIVNTSGINSQASIGGQTDYSEVSQGVEDILTANYDGEISDLAWIQNPDIAGVIDQLKTGISSDNTPLIPTPWVSQLRRLHTTNLSADNASPPTYNSVIGYFPELLVGMRTSGVVFDVLDSGSVTDADSTTWNGATQFLRFIRARLRADVVCLRPGWFSVLSGLTA